MPDNNLYKTYITPEGDIIDSKDYNGEFAFRYYDETNLDGKTNKILEVKCEPSQIKEILNLIGNSIDPRIKLELEEMVNDDRTYNAQIPL